MDKQPNWGGKQGTRHQRGYGTRWDKLRARILERDLYLCQECLRQGRPTPLKVKPYDHAVDHILAKAFGGTDDPSNLESLCKECHDAKSVEELKDANGSRRRMQYDDKGFPVWDDHARRWGYSIPDNVKPSGIPVVLVCGPPASGKTTWAQARAQANDVVIDLDDYCVNVGGAKWDTRKDIIRKAFRLRDGAIHSLHRLTQGTCYLIVTAPTDAERKTWAKALSQTTIKIIATHEDECIARINAEPSRKDAATRQIEAVKHWWRVN